jgi:hypothetical protein
LLKLPALEVQRYEKFYGSIPNYLIRPDKYQRWSVSGQLTALPSRTLTVTVQSSLFNGDQQQGSLQSALLQLMGEYVNPSQLSNTQLISNEVEKVTDHKLSTTNVLTASWRPYPWLPMTMTGGINTTEQTDERLIPYGINSGGPGNTVSFPDTDGAYGVGHGTSQSNTLSAGTEIPTLRDRVKIGIGGNMVSQSTADATQVVDMLSPGVTKPSGCPTGAAVGQGCNFSQQTSASSTYGWYVEPRLNVASRFFASPGFRLDGGSASGSNGGFSGTGLTAFPKIDFSWLAIDQDNPRGWVTLLRPRVAFGYAGTQPGPTEKLRLFNAQLGVTGAGTPNGVTSGQCSIGGNVGNCPTYGILNGVQVPLVTLSSLGNTKLQPEKSRELEGGGDVELWNSRLSLNWTQYNKTRYNAIISVPVAPSVAGGGSIETNIGVVRNTGTEVTLSVKPIDRRAVRWMVGGNFSRDRNLVVRLNSGQSAIELPSLVGSDLRDYVRIAAGYPLFARFERPIAGFADVNGNGIVDPNEVILGDSVVYVGQSTPKYQLNANTDLALLDGRLSVAATFSYQNGMTQDNAGALTSGTFSQTANALSTSLATQAALVAATELPNGGSQIGVLQTVNVFRFNTLSINYVLPKTSLRWLRVPRASIAVQGSNLALHTNYRGKDPDVNAFSAVSSADETVDLGQLPEPRTWWLRLTLGN